MSSPCHGLFVLRKVTLGLLAHALAIAVAAAAPVLPYVRVHADGHYLETEDGRPFFWLGDTAWELMRATRPDESSYYLRTRAQQGYNVIQVIAFVGGTGETAGGANGQMPFFDADPSRPNDAYFKRLSEIVDEANALGLYVAVLPTWGEKLSAPWGDGPRMFRDDNLRVCREYGAYLGRLLRGRTNVIWMMGGDRPAKLDQEKPIREAVLAGFPAGYDWTPIWEAMLEGIEREWGGKPLRLYHPNGRAYTSATLHDETWLDVHSMQSGHSSGFDFPVWEWIQRDFALEPKRPTLDLEPNYEDHPVSPYPRWNPAVGHFRDHDVRKQSYRSVLSGGCGVTYGHHAVWFFAGSFNGPFNQMDRHWIDGLHRPAGRQMIYLRALIESRPFFTRVPDDALFENASVNRADHMSASRDREGSYAMIYFPTPDQVATVDLAKLRAPQLRGWWYDPRTGFAHPLGLLDGGKKREFQSPPYGPDWVLVLDDPAAGYPAPGARSLDADRPLSAGPRATGAN